MQLNLQKLRPLGFILAGLLVYGSCRKIDQQTGEIRPLNSKSKFFTEHASSKPLVQAINQFFLRLNEKENYVDKTIKKIGFPRWDKAITVNFSGTLSRGAADSTDLTYIPFVREGDTVVNASLLVQTSPSDTVFKYICDWQYQYLPNGLVGDTSVTAERIAFILMRLDNEVFGHTKFKLTDGIIFQNYFPDSLKDNQRYLEIGGQYGNKNSGTNISHAMAASITFTVYCGSCASLYWQIIYYYNLDGIPTWEFPESGGGGSGGSSSTPPDCPGIPIARTENVTDPCTPGWIPIPPLQPPCDPYISSLAADTVFKNRFIYLNHNDRTGGTKEHGFAVFDRAAGNYQLKIGQNHVRQIPWKDVILMGMKVDGILHNHYLNCNNIFSPDDILLMSELFIKGYVRDTTNLFMGMTSNTDAPYLIKVTNPAKFRQFANKILELEAKNNWFSKTYNDKLRSGDNTKNLKAFFEMLQEHGGLAGLSVFEAVPDGFNNYNFDEWKKLNWDGNGDFNPATICN